MAFGSNERFPCYAVMHACDIGLINIICIVQPLVHLSTVGSRAFSVTSPQLWNYLPLEVTSALSLTTFHTQLEMFLFTESYPDINNSNKTVSKNSVGYAKNT